MNHLFRKTATLAALALTVGTTCAANPPAGYVDFGKLSPGSSGREFVEVNVNSNLISMVARIAQKSQPEIADLLQGLQAVRVNVIGLDKENRGEIAERIKAIRSQLDSAGWERIVTVKQKKEDVGIYLKTRGPEAVEGVVVTVLNGDDEAVFVNVVGNIDPEKLGELGEQFNIDPLKKLGPVRKNKAAVEAEEEN